MLELIFNVIGVVAWVFNINSFYRKVLNQSSQAEITKDCARTHACIYRQSFFLIAVNNQSSETQVIDK